MVNTVTIYINDKEYKVKPNQTIMQAADSMGFHIPRLCHPKLSIEGVPRVYRGGRGHEEFRGLLRASVSDGLRIRTNTTELRRARRDIVELILDNHPRTATSVSATAE